MVRAVVIATVAAWTLGASSNARAAEPIVGFWQITAKDAGNNAIDHIWSAWTSDGLEFDQDTSPILILNNCYGKWVKLGKRTYGLTHPFFNFMDPNVNGEGSAETIGQWDGTSALITYTVVVAKDGKSFKGNQNFKVIDGPDPYDPNAAVLATIEGVTVTAKKVVVDKSTLPPVPSN